MNYGESIASGNFCESFVTLTWDRNHLLHFNGLHDIAVLVSSTILLVWARKQLRDKSSGYYTPGESSTIFPVHAKLLVALAVSALFIHLLTEVSRFIMWRTSYTFLFAIPHAVVQALYDSITVLLLSDGIGRRSMRLACIVGSASALLNLAVLYALGATFDNPAGPFVVAGIALYVGTLLGAYTALALAPSRGLTHRRPAARVWARFLCAFVWCFWASVALVRLGLDAGWCAYAATILVFMDTLLLWVAFHAFALEADFWHGLEVSNAGLADNACGGLCARFCFRSDNPLDGGGGEGGVCEGGVSSAINAPLSGVELTDAAAGAMSNIAAYLKSGARDATAGGGGGDGSGGGGFSGVQSWRRRSIHGSYRGKRRAHAARLLDFTQLRILPSKVLGTGSSARVYEGTWRRSTRCAVKVLYTVEISADEIRRTCLEASLLSALQGASPHVVGIFGVAVLPPSLCVVLELCSEGSLGDVLYATKAARARSLLARISTMNAAGAWRQRNSASTDSSLVSFGSEAAWNLDDDELRITSATTVDSPLTSPFTGSSAAPDTGSAWSSTVLPLAPPPAPVAQPGLQPGSPVGQAPSRGGKFRFRSLVERIIVDNHGSPSRRWPSTSSGGSQHRPTRGVSSDRSLMEVFRYTLPWEQRLELALGACRGVAAIERALPGYSHNDIKSANFLVQRNDETGDHQGPDGGGGGCGGGAAASTAAAPPSAAAPSANLSPSAGLKAAFSSGAKQARGAAAGAGGGGRLGAPDEPVAGFKFIVKVADCEFCSKGATPAHMAVGTAASTPHWTAPEVLSGAAPVSPASDVFALGCVMFEVASRAVPFAGEPASSVARLYLAGRRPPFPSSSQARGLARAPPPAQEPVQAHDGGGGSVAFAPPKGAKLAALAALEARSFERYTELVGRAWAEDPGVRPSAAELCKELERLRAGFLRAKAEAEADSGRRWLHANDPPSEPSPFGELNRAPSVGGYGGVAGDEADKAILAV